MVEKERIAAITFLGIDPIYSYEWQAVQGITTYSGLAESIIPLQPDLIIGSTYSTGNTIAMMAQLGYPTTTFDSPTTLNEAETLARDIGKAVGESERAEQLIQTMRADIAKAKAIVDGLPPQLAISWA